MNLYTYYGPSDNVRHTALIATAKAEAANETASRMADWTLESVDYCNDEVFNEDTKSYEPEAKVVLRRTA